MKKIVYAVLRITITLIILFFILKTVDFSKSFNILANSNLSYLFVSLLFVFLFSFIVVLRWYYILIVYKFKIHFYEVFKIYMISFFFNNFLPSTVGMDVVRGAYVAGSNRRVNDVISTIFIERWIGFLGIIIYISLIPLIFIKQINPSHFLPVSITGLSLSLIVITSIWNDNVYAFLKKILLKILFFNIGNKLLNLYTSIRQIKNHKKLFIINLLLSISIQILFVFANYFVVKAQLLDISFINLVIYIPLIAIISMIPLTVNGIGLREWAYITFFTETLKEQSFSLSITVFLLMIIFSLIGGIYFIFYKKIQRS